MAEAFVKQYEELTEVVYKTADTQLRLQADATLTSVITNPQYIVQVKAVFGALGRVEAVSGFSSSSLLFCLLAAILSGGTLPLERSVAFFARNGRLSSVRQEN